MKSSDADNIRLWILNTETVFAYAMDCLKADNLITATARFIERYPQAPDGGAVVPEHVTPVLRELPNFTK